MMLRATAVCVLAVLSLPSWRGLRSQPRLEVDGGDMVNMGKQYVGEVHTSIIIRNAGNQILAIDKIVPSTHRVLPQITRKMIPPGDTATLNIWMDHGRFLGEHKDTISISSNSEPNGEAKIQLMEEVKGSLTITKHNSDFPQCEINQPVMSEIDLANYDDTLVTARAIIADQDTTIGIFKVDDNRTFMLSPGTSRALHFTYIPYEVGYAERNIIIQSDCRHSPKMNVRMSFNVVDTLLHK
jgi:hypothetical protein